MRNRYLEFYNPTDEEIKLAWSEGLIAFDANVLFNLYRYSKETRDDLFKAIEWVNERVWLPHQAGYEFHKNRLNVILTESTAYESIIEKMDAHINKLNSEMDIYSRHSLIDIKNLKSRFSKMSREVKDHLNSIKSKHPDFSKEDYILEKITKIFEGRTGDPFSEEELSKIYAEGKIRYENSVPPGYADKKSKEHSGDRSLYGDLIIWKELINRTKKNKMPLIFVTDDRKEDWWFRFDGKTIGPRRELISEFFKETQIRILIYQADIFLKYAQKHFVREIKPKSIEETRLLREKDEDEYKSIIELFHANFPDQRELDPLFVKSLKEANLNSTTEFLNKSKDYINSTSTNPALEYFKGNRDIIRSISETPVTEFLRENKIKNYYMHQLDKRDRMLNYIEEILKNKDKDKEEDTN